MGATCAMACATSLKIRSASGFLVPPTCSPLSLCTTTATATYNAPCSSTLASSRLTGRFCHRRHDADFNDLYENAPSGSERRADPEYHARAVLAVERVGAAAVEFRDQPHDIEAETQVRLAAACVAHRDHRFEQLARHRFRQARAAVGDGQHRHIAARIEPHANRLLSGPHIGSVVDHLLPHLR